MKPSSGERKEGGEGRDEGREEEGREKREEEGERERKERSGREEVRGERAQKIIIMQYPSSSETQKHRNRVDPHTRVWVTSTQLLKQEMVDGGLHVDSYHKKRYSKKRVHIEENRKEHRTRPTGWIDRLTES